MQENYPYLLSIKKLKPEFESFHKIYITSEEFTVGRSLENSAVIAFIAISRKHCVFKKVNDYEWGIEDCSTFGIDINNCKMKKGNIHILSHNDIIQLDATGDFVYKFVNPNEHDNFTPRKRIKLEEDIDIIGNVKLKFDESQHFEILHIEEKIQNTKQLQNSSIILKKQLELDMNRKIEQLTNNFAKQIENLEGEKNEVERQKETLEQERDFQLTAIKEEMESKIVSLMEQIKKHSETESALLDENNLLKEKLNKEREDFLLELHKENSSKKDLLEQLESKMKEQEEIRLKEKQELQEALKKENDQLMLAKEKELQELEVQKKLREEELGQELNKIKLELEEQVQKTLTEKLEIEKELKIKMEAMAKVSEEEKSKVEKLLQERSEAEKKLSEAEANAEKSLQELQQRVRDRETELAALAAERIQKQAEQSTEVITSLQQQLENVRSQLQTVETEKNILLEGICSAPSEETSKQATLHEVGQLMESELQCSICAELFVQATTLNCSHTYCKYCITLWKKKKKECPICRAPITSECKSLVLDSFIEKMVGNLTDEMKSKRQAMLKDREELDAELLRTNSEGTNRRSVSDDSSSYNSGYDSELGEEEEDYEREYLSFGEYEDDLFDSDDGRSDESIDSDESSRSARLHAGDRPPVLQDSAGPSTDGRDASNDNRRGDSIEGLAGSYYGGYGRCFKCGATGHWAPGCPF